MNDPPTMAARQSVPQSRSTSNLAAMRNRSFVTRRRSSFNADDFSSRPSDESARDNSDGLPELQSQVLSFSLPHWASEDDRLRRMSTIGSIPASLVTPEMRSQRLIGNSNPRYKWEQYWKTEKQLKAMSKSLRKYYERECNQEHTFYGDNKDLG